MNSYNRIANCTNRFQGPTKRVLCVCSAGLLRSPTTAVVLSAPPFNFNTRAAGLFEDFALIPVDDVLLVWADEVVCFDNYQQTILQDKLRELDKSTPVINLNIADRYGYRDPELVEEIKRKYKAYGQAQESETEG